MSMTFPDLAGLVDDRDAAAQAVDQRDTRMETWGAQKERLRAVHRLDKGDFDSLFPGEQRMSGRDYKHIQNIEHDGRRDLVQLVPQTTPSISVPPRGNADSAVEEAHLLAAIGMGYWEAREGERMVRRLVSDILDGMAFVVSYADPAKGHYPCHTRLKPLGCYPSYYQDDLIDLVYTEQVLARVARVMFPWLDIQADSKRSEWVEIIDFFTRDRTIKAVSYLHTDRVRRYGDPMPGYLASWQRIGGRIEGEAVFGLENRLGRPPISWTVIEGPDDEVEGYYDQIAPPMRAWNRIVTQQLDGTDRAVYAPRVYTAPPLIDEEGPDGKIVMNPENPGTVAYLAPPQLSNNLVYLGQFLERSARGTASFAATRNAEGMPSIASASFVEVASGQENATVEWLRRELAHLRKQMLDNDYRVDKLYLPGEKPLIFPVRKRKTYSTDDIYEWPSARVVYGDFGMSGNNANTQRIQKAGAGMISWEEAREQDPSILNPLDTARKVRMQAAADLVFQKIQAGTRSGYAALRYQVLLAEGKDEAEVAKELLADPRVLAELGEEAYGEGRPAEPTTPEEQASALAKGATSPQALQPQFGGVTPLPYTYSNIRNNGGGR